MPTVVGGLPATRLRSLDDDLCVTENSKERQGAELEGPHPGEAAASSLPGQPRGSRGLLPEESLEAAEAAKGSNFRSE